MRALLVLGLVAAAAFAGCTASSPSTDPTPIGNAPMVKVLPKNFTASKTVMAQADITNLAMQPICSSPAAKCDHYTVDSNVTTNMTATLTWTQGGQDFDLYLYQNGQLVSNDGINSAGTTNPNDYIGTTQVMHVKLAKGTYDLIVVPWLVAQDTYTLDVHFAK